jgi:hypothetical protein
MNGSSVHLVELVSYRASDSSSRHERRIVATLEHGPIQPGTSDYWEGVALTIPPLPPSGLGGHCRIMDVQYKLEFRVDPSGLGMDLVNKLDIIIGKQELNLKGQSHKIFCFWFQFPPSLRGFH